MSKFDEFRTLLCMGILELFLVLWFEVVFCKSCVNELSLFILMADFIGYNN